MKNCSNCIYFDKFKEQHREDNEIGSCKANPPFLPQTVVVMRGAIKFEKESSLGQWPLVLATFWCGIWKGENE